MLLQGKESGVVGRTYPDFQYANSFCGISTEVIYTSNNANLLYNANIYRKEFNESYYFNRYYKNPEEVLFKKISSNEIYYTKINKGHRDLYAFNPSTFRESVLEKKIVGNFVHGNMQNSYLAGVYGLREENGKLTAFVEEKVYDKNIIELDTIPFNHDFLGQVPDILVTEEGGVFKGIYTSFDENGLGSIFMKTSIRNNPEVIVKDEFIAGKLCYINYIKDSEYSGVQRKIELILYNALENGELKIKLVDINDKSINDITEFFGKVSI